MNFLLAFENSGDVIPFASINHDVVEYYYECLTKQNINKFSIPESFGKNALFATQQLDDTVKEINKWIYELIEDTFTSYKLEDYLDQRILNKYHFYWVESQSTVYNTIDKLKKYNSDQARLIHSYYSDDIVTTTLNAILPKLGYRDQYNKLNTDVHQIESLFRSEILLDVPNEHYVEFNNHFSKTILTNNIANFRIRPRLLGRTLYNKYINFDFDLEFDDINNFDSLPNYPSMNLSHPQTIALSNEYIDWCKLHNKIPSGDYLNIGNIIGLTEKLTDYRKILVRNSLQNNKFSIQLDKG